MEFNRIIQGDSLQALKTLPDKCVDMCVTSPPYYNLRDYGMQEQIGLEDTPEAYIGRLASVFDEVRRVLKDEGTLWVNIGDSYNGNKVGNTNAKWDNVNTDTFAKTKWTGAKNKDLIGIPFMLAFELRARGWYLRQDIIWDKSGNAMPESVTDRCVKAHEYIFLLSKQPRYYFDHEAIQEKAAGADIKHNASKPASNTKNLQYDGQKPNTMHINRELGLPDKEYLVRNKRDVWAVNTKPCKEAHFAVFPEELIAPCILAGCVEGGVVLDPFMGSGTTAIVARKLGRRYLGCELNPDYVSIAERRLRQEVSLFDQA